MAEGGGKAKVKAKTAGATSTSFGVANSNVRDVLAPLFCNGRSFSSLIDELCRHFKIEGGGEDANVSVLEASSESQSTDSEAEGNMSDEASAQLVEARAHAQLHSLAKPMPVSCPTAPTAGGFLAATSSVHTVPDKVVDITDNRLGSEEGIGNGSRGVAEASPEREGGGVEVGNPMVGTNRSPPQSLKPAPRTTRSAGASRGVEVPAEDGRQASPQQTNGG
ncbi:unnamed protein product, partial [Discosporangium mesarthrocarpum]